MLAISLFTGFFACILLFFLELFFLEPGEEAPRWLDYVDGPYVRKKYTAFQGRDW